MPRTKPTGKAKEASFERHARAIQGDIARLTKSMKSGFKSIREEMATKADLAVTHAAISEVRDDVRRLNSILVSKAQLSEAIEREFDVKPYAKESEVKDLEQRMARVEETLKMKPTRRAA